MPPVAALSPSISLAYDVMNRMTNVVDAVGMTKYNHDSVGQILSEDEPWSDDTARPGVKPMSRRPKAWC